MDEDILVIDRMARQVGGKGFNSSKDAKLVEDYAEGKIKVIDGEGTLLAELGIIGENRFGLVVYDDQGNAQMFQGRDGDFYGVKTSKLGYSVFEDTNISTSTSRYPIRISLSSFVNMPDAINDSIDGFISYDASTRNFVVELPFYVPNDVTIESVSVKALFYDTYYFTANQRAIGSTLYLNPKREWVNGSFGQDYVRFSEGTELFSDYNPYRDLDEKIVLLTGEQLTKINRGWNSIVLQQDFVDTLLENFAYAQLSIELNGYKEFSF
jgi:hypothetical protein